jgi:hypothetical protein
LALALALTPLALALALTLTLALSLALALTSSALAFPSADSRPLACRTGSVSSGHLHPSFINIFCLNPMAFDIGSFSLFQFSAF